METSNNFTTKLKEAWDNPKKRILLILFGLFTFLLLGGFGYLLTLGNEKDEKTKNEIPEPNAILDTTQKSKLDVYNTAIKEEGLNESTKKGDMTLFENEIKKSQDDKKTNDDIYSDFGGNPKNDNYLVKDNSDNSLQTTKTEKPQRIRTVIKTTEVKEIYSKNQVSAVVHNWGREIRSGSNIRIRTTEEFKVNGTVVPENTYLYAAVSASGERMQMYVSGANVNNVVISLNLEVYDYDGVAGIKIPTHLVREITNDVVTNVVENTKTTVKLGNLGEVSTNIGKKSQNNPNILITDGYKIFLKPRKN